MMQEIDSQYVKILFRFYSKVLDEWTVETMWAEVFDLNKGYYKLASIPFYIPNVSSEDIVFAEYDETEQMLTYRETIHHSGNSIVQVVIMDKTIATKDILAVFSTLGCRSEQFQEGYFVIEIPAAKAYFPIKKKLSALRDKRIIDYAEPNLAEQHWY